MKYLYLAVMLTSFSALALEVKVSHLSSEPQMDRSFVLKTNLTQKVILDCQSFLQGLYIGPRSGGDFSMLDPDECHGLYLRIKESLKSRSKHCLDVEDQTIRSDFSC